MFCPNPSGHPRGYHLFRGCLGVLITLFLPCPALINHIYFFIFQCPPFFTPFSSAQSFFIANICPLTPGLHGEMAEQFDRRTSSKTQNPRDVFECTAAESEVQSCISLFNSKEGTHLFHSLDWCNFVFWIRYLVLRPYKKDILFPVPACIRFGERVKKILIFYFIEFDVFGTTINCFSVKTDPFFP